MRDEDLDEREETNRQRKKRTINNDPFYPDSYHEDDMRADIVDISEPLEEESE